MDEYLANHRCNMSTAAGVSIRYERMFAGDDYSWCLRVRDWTSWDEVYMMVAATAINYCPFCGAKLESIAKETADDRYRTLNQL